jgi:anti-sigma factor ChrR (cupin superfamily)
MQFQGFRLEIDEAALPWRSTRHAGIEWFPLHPPAEAAGPTGPRDSTVLIRMAPGRGYPRHRHLGVEEVLILCGGYRDERGEHGPGTYLRYEPHSEHTPVALGDAGAPIGPHNPACILFAVARGGVQNQ